MDNEMEWADTKCYTLSLSLEYFGDEIGTGTGTGAGEDEFNTNSCKE